MNLLKFITGEHQPTVITAPPRGVEWRKVRPKQGSAAVRAWRSESDHAVRTSQGELHARRGADYIVEYDDGDHAVVRADIFEQTYQPLGGNLYRKRADIVHRYFTLKHPALVETLEGVQEAEAGDWIMQGVAGELWPVPRDEALEKYEPV